MGKILNEEFFIKDTSTVAKSLLGKFLVRKIGNKKITGMIIETEAYDGPNDMASHAFKGKTPRTEVMFSYPGTFYVYLCYGVHDMLNIVTREHGYPGAVLIRGIMINRESVLQGPGKVTKFLTIDKKFNNKKAVPKTGLWFEDRGITIKKNHMIKTPRIGVAYAGPVWSKKKMRFVVR